MAGKNIDALDNFDDLEYNARKEKSGSSDIGIHTTKRVTEITEQLDWNFAKMRLGEIKAWTGSPVHTSTIKHQLHKAKIFPDTASGKYDLRGRELSEIIGVIHAKSTPRPDAIEIAGGKAAYEAALDARQLENTLDRLAEPSNAPIKRRYTY